MNERMMSVPDCQKRSRCIHSLWHNTGIGQVGGCALHSLHADVWWKCAFTFACLLHPSGSL